MMGTPTNRDSHNIMNLIEKGSVGAEIGVWMGSSSRQFVKQNPSMLYLVDPWAVRGYDEALAAKDETFDYDKYLNNYKKLAGKATPESFDVYYDDVAAQVDKEFGGLPNVEVCRMTATEWFNTYSELKLEPFLDWIYIDGDHSYTGAYNDFCNALKVVKKGGYIIGDDYKWGKSGDKGGVKQAVNQWAEENDLELQQYGNFQVVVQL
jgi:hypothetical protein